MDTAALPETCCPTLWLRPGRAAYLGPSFRLDTHSGSVHCFALGVDAPFVLRSADTGERRVRSALITARTPHHVIAGDGRMLFCYLDRLGELRSAMTERHTSVDFGHRDEDQLARDPHKALRDLLGSEPGEVDERIAKAVLLLHDRNASAADIAAAVNLSTSRFLHLFSAQMATSFRRYRLWARMARVAEAVSAGDNLTTAAVAAGFASPGHFSDAFRAMFGLTASVFLASGTQIITMV
ncbi:helix-turn-helix domain-containing protein [Allokutzneria sp. A3M-2-11 16]|uniref:helix-turn-helix transcriptional regulator n=1 Tax=Allokutzneria sp. A3M-2-11 16 TaxID=2962043 RepID=UPI0020B7F5CD|nr:helix-turn-helix domain-containing protein [Allokutzneria sp. A3M-2-11 16]MCP3803206.1 helix-turn-helix domain-containing protein [Allokutzneria sp. A3M-2-11 16]